jgi:hypothetical protein
LNGFAIAKRFVIPQIGNGKAPTEKKDDGYESMQ